MDDIFYFSEDEDDDTVNVISLANAETETPGLIIGAAFDANIATPTVNNGLVVMPAYPTPAAPTYTITRNDDDEAPEPGVDGWVITMYQPMLSWNGGADIASFRQLMRIYNNEIQVSCQYQLYPDGQPTAWMPIYIPE